MSAQEPVTEDAKLMAAVRLLTRRVCADKAWADCVPVYACPVCGLSGYAHYLAALLVAHKRLRTELKETREQNDMLRASETVEHERLRRQVTALERELLALQGKA